MAKSTLTKGKLVAFMNDHQADAGTVMTILGGMVEEHAVSVNNQHNKWLLLNTTAKLLREAERLYHQAPGQARSHRASKLIELCGGEITLNEYHHLGVMMDAIEMFRHAESNLDALRRGEPNYPVERTYEAFNGWFYQLILALVKRFPDEIHGGTGVMKLIEQSVYYRTICQEKINAQAAPAQQ